MRDLENKIQRMLNGEKKRREVAFKWLERITDLLKDVGKDVWGQGEQDPFYGAPGATRVHKLSNGKWVPTDLYFRYDDFVAENNDVEYTGFYLDLHGNDMIWGEPVEDLFGKDFWWAIRTIMEWLPHVVEIIEQKQTSRDALTEKLQRMIEA